MNLAAVMSRVARREGWLNAVTGRDTTWSHGELGNHAIDTLLLRHTRVGEAGVVDAADDERGKRVVAFFVRAPGADAHEHWLDASRPNCMVRVSLSRQRAFGSALPEHNCGRVLRVGLLRSPLEAHG